jgi:hypothetical protein
LFGKPVPLQEFEQLLMDAKSSKASSLSSELA